MSDSFSHDSSNFTNTTSCNSFYSSGSLQSMTNSSSPYYTRSLDHGHDSSSSDDDSGFNGSPLVRLVRAFIRAWNEEPPANWNEESSQS